MDNLLNPEAVAALQCSLSAAAPVPGLGALADCVPLLDALSLRGRTDLLAGVLTEAYSGYPEAAAAYRGALKDPAFKGWAMWPVTESAVTLALAAESAEYFDDALALLAELTPRLTSEFAIRRLLAADLDRALGVIQGWTADPDPQVRRLASEGTRPYLPWAVRVPALLGMPEATLPILDALRDDPSEDVRRSVANHLNDISRHAPRVAVRTAARWQETATPVTGRVVRHGLRTLIKRADADALALLGFAPAQVEVQGPESPTASVALPGSLEFRAVLRNTSASRTRLAVDYVIHYVKANGGSAPKVFKLAVLELAPGESRTVTGSHAFRQMTTRRHYAGQHVLELQVNGVRHGHLAFEVEHGQPAQPGPSAQRS